MPGGIFRLVTERFQRRAGLEHLINLRAERAREVGELQPAGALVLPAKMPSRGLVRVQHLQIAPDDDAGAAQFAQHVGHHLVVAGQLVVQPDVAEREADLFEQMENQFQLHVHQWFAGYAAIKRGDANNRVAAGDGHGHLRAKQLKFLLRLPVGARLIAVAAENAAELGDLRTDAGIQRQLKMFEQPVGQTDGRSRAQPPRVFRRHDLGERRTRTVEKNGGAVDAQNVAEKLQKLFQHRLGIERVREDGRKIPQHVQRLCGVHEAAAGLRIHGGARENGGVARRHIGHRARRGGRSPKLFQDGIQQPLPHRLGQDVRDAVQKRLLFPVRLRRIRVGDDGGFFVVPAQALDVQDAFDAHELGVEDDRAGEAVDDERLGLVHIEPVDDAVFLGIQRRADGLREVGMGGQNQDRLHCARR